MVALTVELDIVSECVPGLKVLGYRRAQQRAFSLARVVELGRGFEVVGG